MREESEPNAAALRRLRDRAPGWETDWGELYVLLEERVARIARRHRGFPDPVNDREDFVAEMMLWYHRRARRGLLLAGWDEESPVLAFLTAIVPLRILSFLGRRAREAARRREDPIGSFGGAVARAERLAELLEDLVLDRPEGKIGRVPEQAGIQLHPRLDWERLEHAWLREHLALVLVHDEEGWTVRCLLLDDTHAEAAAAHEERIDSLAIAIEAYRPRPGTKLLAELERKLEDALVEATFSPISAERLVALLGLDSVNNGEQLRSRYRRALPRLLARLWTDYLDLLDLDPEASGFDAAVAEEEIMP